MLQLVEDTQEKNILLKGYFKAENAACRPNALHHLFDETARGLISVYVALQEFLDADKNNQKAFREKSLLEVVVSSNYRLNRYQDLIFSSFIQFGADKQFSQVRFDNFTDWLNEKTKKLNEQNIPNNEKTELIRADLEQEVDDFRIFVCLDWAARLLEDADALSSQAYHDAKKKMFVSLCVNGKILNQQWVLENNFRNIIKQCITEFPSVKEPFCNIAMYTLFRLPFAMLVRYPDIKELSQKLEKSNPNSKIKLEEAAGFTQITELLQFLEFVAVYCKNDYSLVATYLIDAGSVILAVLQDYLKQDKNSFIINTICKDLFVQGSNSKNEAEIPRGGQKISPFYLMYSQNGLRISSKGNNNFDYFLPDYISEQGKPERKKFLTARAIKYSCDSFTKVFIPMIKKSGDIFPKITVDLRAEDRVEDFIWKLWEKLFYELNSAAAIPFYNYYSKKICDGIFDSDGQIVPLNQKYDLKSTIPMVGICPNDMKNDKESQRMQVLFSIDGNVSWRETDEALEDDSLLVIVKRFIEKQLKNIEKEIYNEMKSRPYDNRVSDENLVIDITDSLQAFKAFEKSDKGISNTLAEKCYNCIRQFYTNSGDSKKIYVKTIDYIYLYAILTEFVESKARYARPEGRELLEALNQASMKFQNNLPETILSAYKFWFHCYCRYRVAELSDNMYGVVTKLYQYKKLLEYAYKQQDEQIQSQYFDTFEKATDLPPELIKQIPNLFR